MNKAFIVGNVCADPAMFQTKNGKTVCNFNVAVTNRRLSGESTVYFKCAAWNATADLCNKFLSKGKKVAISGSVSSEAYMARDGKPRSNVKIDVEDIEFLSPRADSMDYSAPTEEDTGEVGGYIQVDSDQLPF